MSIHSRGPWRAEFSKSGGYDCMTDAWVIRTPGAPFIVCTVDLSSYGQSASEPEMCNRPHAEADARLIAAAPEMYAALKTITEWFEHMRSDHEEKLLGGLSRAERNWPTLSQEPLDMLPAIEAIKKVEAR